MNPCKEERDKLVNVVLVQDEAALAERKREGLGRRPADERIDGRHKAALHHGAGLGMQDELHDGERLEVDVGHPQGAAGCSRVSAGSMASLGSAHALLAGVSLGVWVWKRGFRTRALATPVTLRVGGVPEHFNLPFKDAIEPLARLGVHVVWTDQPNGTGAMTKELREGGLDVAIVLTEGIVADLAKGNPSLLVSQYVQSPLRWGVHVASGSAYNSIGELRGRRFGISRLGSGSHLMAYVLAKEHGWELTNLKFVVVGGLEQARAAFKSSQIDAYMWEEFTTKPLVYSGEWRCVGTCTTPWPCFAVAATKAVLAEHADAIVLLMGAVRAAARRFKSHPDESARRVSEVYGIRPEDARSWFAMTEWSCKMGMEEKMLRRTADILREVGILTADADVACMIAKL